MPTVLTTARAKTKAKASVVAGDYFHQRISAVIFSQNHRSNGRRFSVMLVAGDVIFVLLTSTTVLVMPLQI